MRGGRSEVIETARSLQENLQVAFDLVTVYTPASVCSANPAATAVHPPPNFFAHGRDITEMYRNRRVKVLVLCPGAPPTSERIRPILATRLVGIAGPHLNAQHMAGLPLVHVSTSPVSHFVYKCKCVVDIIGTLDALVFLT